MKTQPSALDFLLADLDVALSEPGRGTRVAKLLEGYAASRNQDWRQFALFNADYYSRNLVRRSDLYELIVLCWSVGQRSPIHDHSGQRCWMAVLDGSVRESMFKVAADSGGGLSAGPVREVGAGGVAFINDEQGWHRIEACGGVGAVTLHLYSRPILDCRVVDDETGAILTKLMRYHSVGGILQP